MSSDRRLHIVLFGATGYTGTLVADYLARSLTPIRWAIAGRNADKLEAVKAELPSGPAGAPEVIVADANDPAALAQMAAETRVVISTVGPYICYGEPLVKACAEAGTDYVDLTGEPAFVDRMRARYHDTAQRSGAKIVNSCGFDSIPHDLGVLFTVESLRRRMNDSERDQTPIDVEGFVRFKGHFSGGTWHSALTIMAEPIPSRREPVEGARRVGSVKPKVSYRKDLRLWAVPMPTIDPQVVLESARLLDSYGPDFRYGHYLGLRNLHQVLGLGVGVAAVYGMAQLKPTRELLKKLKAPGDGPTEAQREEAWFEVTFQGKAGTHRSTCVVAGGDPGYGDTAKMLAESALCLALDREKLPPHCGVVPSAAAIGMPLIPRLRLAGISFEERPQAG